MDLYTTMGGKMIVYTFLLIILFLQVLPVVAGEYCEYGVSTYSLYYYSRYCSNGCCGSKSSSYSDVCCDEIAGGAIAGIVIGILALLGIVIGFIVCCCVAANNSSRRTGTVIQPGNTGIQTVVVNSTALSHGQTAFPGQLGAVGYGHPFAVQPPPYAQHNNVSQGSVNQAYPPPPPAKY